MGFRFDLTPEMATAALDRLRDDVEAFVYYGTVGLLDPKMPVEAWFLGGGSVAGAWAGWNAHTLRNLWALRPSPVGYAKGAARSSLLAIAGAGAIGWYFDLGHRREGGWDEKDWSYHSDVAYDAYDW